jgi:hypothetical protein
MFDWEREMKRLLLVLMVATMFIFLQPGKQPVLGRANRDHRRAHSRMQRSTGIAQAKANKVSWWKTECVVCPKQFSIMPDRNIRLDAQGHPHIAYGGKHLYYVYYDGIEWHYETVDDSYDVGYSASLALDEYGYPHISYLGAAGSNYYLLKYAYQDIEGWHIQIVEGSDIAGQTNSLALDSEGRPHISYVRSSSDDGLRYAYLDNDGWHTELVDIWVGSVDTSLALDSSDQPHISYYAYGVMHAHKDDTGWQIQTIDGEGYSSSLVLDKNGYPHISYDVPNSSVHYAFQDEGGWHYQILDSDGSGEPSLVLDEDGNPHISYSWLFDAYEDQIKLVYVYFDIENWHSQTVDIDGNAGYWSSLILDGDGYPHIISGGYPDYSESFSNLVYICRDMNGWHSQVVDSEGAVGEYASLAVDGYGKPHIIYSYSGVDTSRLMYAHKDMTGWQFQEVDSPGTVHGSQTIVLDDGDYPHIVYASNGVLKYAHRGADGWHIETVDSRGGGFISLALDQDEYPHISYMRDYSLMYAYQDIMGWYIDTIGDCGDAYAPCKGTSLALDSDGYPHIGYGAGISNVMDFGDVMYAYLDAFGWQFEKLDNEGSGYLSLDLDVDGNPHISYHYKSLLVSPTLTLKYASYDANGWNIQTVDSERGVGRFNSLMLDRMGYPHISYISYSGSSSRGEVRYAYQAEAGWNIQTVDSGWGYYLEHTSLALHADGQPHISYGGYGDLWYTYNMGEYEVTYLPLVIK